MAEYIEREALMRNLKQFAPEQLTPLIESLIQKQPAEDVVEVRHGKWLNFYGDYSTAECSVCGEVYDAIQPSEYNKIFKHRRCVRMTYQSFLKSEIEMPTLFDYCMEG